LPVVKSFFIIAFLSTRHKYIGTLNPIYLFKYNVIYKNILGTTMSAYTDTRSEFQLLSDFTTKDLLKLCDDFSKNYSQVHNTNVKFEPEKICEGGIYYKGNNDEYCSIRFWGNGNYPFIESDTIQRWIDGAPIVIYNTCRKGEKLSLRFKAYFGAPTFDIRDIDFIVDWFVERGDRCIRWTKKKDLVFYGELGNML